MAASYLQRYSHIDSSLGSCLSVNIYCLDAYKAGCRSFTVQARRQLAGSVSPFKAGPSSLLQQSFSSC